MNDGLRLYNKNNVKYFHNYSLTWSLFWVEKKKLSKSMSRPI